MRAGKLRHRIVVDEAVTVTDSEFNEPVTSWVARATVWGDIEPLSGSEAAKLGDHLLSQGDTRITLRWTPQIANLNSRWRVRHGGTIYNIVRATNIRMLNRTFELMCTSGVNQG